MKRFCTITCIAVFFCVKTVYLFGQGTVIDNGSPTNKWIFHNPEDDRKTLFIAPLYNGNWDFNQQTQFRPNGDVNFSGKIAIGYNANESATSRLRVYNGGTVLGANTVSHNTDGYLSLGNAGINSTPTLQNWGSATTLLLTNQDYSTIGFHDADSRVDFIRAGNGMIQLGYDGGWGPAHIGLPNGVWSTAGNVGIGNINPVSRLNITGGGLVLGTNATQRNTDGYLSIGNTQTNSTPNTQNWISETSFLLNAQDYTTIGFHDAGQRVDFIRSGNGTIQIGYDGGWGPANVGLPSGVWNSSGNVGIGTSSPGAYKLAVEGKIGAREVEVKTGSWADFVFKDDYKLRPIDEVEKYIATHSHLPEIPSEERVKADGVNLGEMNIKLLQKIEELTLYMIQQQHEITTMKNQITKLVDDHKKK